MAICLVPQLLLESSSRYGIAPDRSFSLRSIARAECELLPHLFSPLPPSWEKRVFVFPMTIGGIVSVTLSRPSPILF